MLSFIASFFQICINIGLGIIGIYVAFWIGTLAVTLILGAIALVRDRNERS